MELFCPECMGPLVTQDGQTARCTLHGGQYRILFARQLPVAEAPAAPPVIGEIPVAPPAVEETPAALPTVEAAPSGPVAPTVCARHPQAPVLHYCGRCGAALCATCEFPQPDGSHWCPDCAAGAPPAWAPGVAAYSPAGARAATVRVALGACAQHPAMPAVAACRQCGARMCATCDFVFPGGVHLCPTCATKPQTDLSPKRKRALWWAYGLAIWCTLGMAVMLSGALAGAAESKEGQQVIGMVMGMFVFIPSIVGTAMAASAYERRLANPASVWGAIVWNSILLAIYLLLILIGTVSGNG